MSLLSRRSLLSTPLAFAVPVHAQALTKLTVGITAGSGMLPPLVARAKGMFAAHGLDATLTRVAFVGLMPPALLSGTFQIGIGTAPTLLQATEGGLDLVAVCGETRMTADNPSASLVVKSGSGIAKPGDLIGKKVGMTGVNGIFDQLFHRWLLDQHVPADKVQIIEMAFPTMHDALRSGAVDAVAAVEPFRSRMVEDGTGVRFADYVAQIGPDVLDTFWMSTGDWARDNTATVAAFRTVIAEAIGFIEAHHDEAKAIEVKETGVTSPFTPTFATAVKPADFVFYGEIGTQLKLLQDVPKPDALILK
jgi:NitT/TauT family transport system substrate-binding protein